MFKHYKDTAFFENIFNLSLFFHFTIQIYTIKGNLHQAYFRPYPLEKGQAQFLGLTPSYFKNV